MRGITASVLAAWVVLSGLGGASLAGDLDIGRAIYEQGRLSSGAPLSGKRFGNEKVAGEAAACITCHRRSGMGAVEGETLVSPITGTALFSETERVIATMDPRRGKSFNRPHPPYTRDTLAAALRQGVHVTGREMSPLMPRYDFTDAEINGLMAYLQQLSTTWSPGVTADSIDFATIITPDVEPKKKAAFVAMVNAMVRVKNSSTRPGRRYMTTPAEMMLKSGRRWRISIWELTGAPETWGAQLAAYYQQQPVFAMISGLSGMNWAPVDSFCQKERIPCLFPSLDATPTLEGQYYPVYFSRGTPLEADVLSAYLDGPAAAGVRRIVQIHGGGFAGREAAARFEQKMAGRPVRLETRLWSAATAPAVLAGVGQNDILVFWLSAEELRGLASLAPPPVHDAYFSGHLIDAEASAVPQAWRASAKLVYPYELPEKRRANLGYLKAWLKLQKIDLVSEPMQSEVFFALNFVTDTVSEMLNNLYRDYLMERAENMVAFREGSKAEQELRDRAVLGRVTLRGTNAPGSSRPESSDLLAMGQQEKGIGDQGGTTVYPRLSLGTGQRFASKGAYIVKYQSPDSDSIVNVSEWLLP